MNDKTMRRLDAIVKVIRGKPDYYIFCSGEMLKMVNKNLTYFRMNYIALGTALRSLIYRGYYIFKNYSAQGNVRYIFCQEEKL